MTLIVCVEDRMGQTFHGRRLSRDKLLCQRIAELVAGRTLRMSPYSKPLFASLSQVDCLAAEDYLVRARGDDLCFVEREDLTFWLERADKLILYRWNRTYPYDLRFPASVLETKWKLTAAADFTGSSHDKITEEIYEKS